MGAPDEALKLMHLLEDLNVAIRLNTEHKSINVNFYYHDGMRGEQSRGIGVRCHLCDEYWSAERAYNPDRDNWRWTAEQLVDKLVGIIPKECWSLVEAALICEWITERLVQAGPKGVPYTHILVEAAKALNTPAERVQKNLLRLGFMEEWPQPVPILMELHLLREFPVKDRVYLPLNHPLCTWEASDEA